jgi:hypothetical protein
MKHTQQLVRRAFMNILGSIVLVSLGVILMLAYFDVLVK